MSAFSLKKMVEDVITERIDLTQKCDFKKAWIPKGWAVIRKEKFIKELAEKITSKFIVVKR